MSVTPSARSNRQEQNFSWTRCTSRLQSGNHLFLGSKCQNESNSHQIEENFSWTRRTSCLQSRNHLFLGSACQNESNRHQLARIGENKFFHELDVHHVYKVGITSFWAQDTKMSLTAISWEKIFHEHDVHHVYKVDTKMSLTAISSLESARRKFFMKSTYIMSTTLESLVFGLGMPKCV